MAGKINGVALAGVAAGALFAYSGVKGKSVLTSLQAIIRGQSPKTVAQTAQITGGGTTAAAAADTTGDGGGGGGGPPTANKALGQLMAAGYGWGAGQQWAYLESGWEEESGWSVTAANVPSDPYNNAYGIPQANPGTKMASAGSDWKTSAATQIKWGLAYIKEEYGSPMGVPGWSANGPLPGYEGY
jgi:hypothetical protein